MNRLTPELQRLMKWARHAEPKPEQQMPLGFSLRVARSWSSATAGEEAGMWQQAIWRSAWAAGAVILFGLALLSAQRLNEPSPYDVSPAYEVVSTELIP